ncbi:hypothetical protein [Nocardioides panaciterrulae]|uniref:Uncharacterized protein n=1 Tax=Nocardioides panaciterrulae TaxID=661492 RepID=A0A7Y9E3M5_9ACTN|nr:hypothetical protein [Nocardioides panaciterrulae]NYD40623.1 hypothetical protein [Nocardioides panaciterrulae]
MTDHELRDLLAERVSDVAVPDLSGRAWERAGRIRRRRATGVVVGAVASVAVVAAALAGVPGVNRSDGPGPGPATHQPAPTGPSGPGDPGRTAPWPGSGATRPDGRYRGLPVYRGPLVSQEATLPGVDSPFPATVDLSAPAPDLADQPIREALAAYVLTDAGGGRRLLLLAPDGSLRSVDTAAVAAYDDGSGQDVSVAHESLLSPTGEYLAFPQAAGEVRVLTLATGEWRTVHTGSDRTATLHWMGDTDLWLPPTTQGGPGPMYSVLDGTRSGATNLQAPAGPFGAGAAPYGRWRMGPGGTAQSWAGVTGLPGPAGEATPAQVLLVQGDPPAPDALLVLGASAAQPRPARCCDVDFWLDDRTVVYESGAAPRRLVAWRVGTHALGVVTRIVGYDPSRVSLVSSYARVWDR